MSKESTLKELKVGVENLEKNIDSFGVGSCERILLPVLKHKEVQDAIIKLISEGYYPFNFDCRDIGFIPGKTFMVTIYFRCTPPRICIVHPRLEIHYDLPSDNVLEIRETF